MNPPENQQSKDLQQESNSWDSLLSDIGIFKCFSPEELRRLYQLGKQQEVRSKSNILIEGENSRGLVILLRGSVSVYKNDPISGVLMRIATLESGAHFGEFSLFDHTSRSATVAAESPCLIFILEADKFENFLQRAGDDVKIRFYQSCAEVLAARFRKLNDDYLHSQQLLWKYALRK
jgi:CRP-like cAMP-binding protein